MVTVMTRRGNKRAWSIAGMGSLQRTLVGVLATASALISPAWANNKPVTWDEFSSHFQFGLHHTLTYKSNKFPMNPNIYYDGPDSPFVKYVREMRTYGFSGILLQIRLRDEDNRIRLGADGKWRIPEWVMKRVKGAVDEATKCGYYLVLEVNAVNYEEKRGAKCRLPHEQRLTDNLVKGDYDAWEQVVEAFKTYRNVGYRVTNEFHGYKYEQMLKPDHPDYLTKEQANDKFIKFITEKGKIARRIKPDAWVFYRNQGQLIGWLYTLKYPLGIDPPPTAKPCYYGISHNFNTGDFYWGYWGLNHPFWTHDQLKYLRINRKLPPHQESSGLLTKLRKINNMGAMANRFAINYHYKPCKYGDRHMTDFQMLAQAEFMLDYFNRNKCICTYADGDTSGGMKDNGIYNTVRQQAHVHNSPVIDEFLHLVLEKSYSRRLRLHTTKGGSIEHDLGKPHNGIHMVRIGDRITLKAKPKAGYAFVGWRGSVNSSITPLTVTVPDSHGTIWAVFARRGERAPNPELYTLKRHWDAHEVIEYGYVDEAKPSTNFGKEEHPLFRPFCRRKHRDNPGGVEKRAFLKFKVSRLPADRSSIAYATIKFHNVSTGSSKPTIYTHSTDSSWKRNTLTWNNMPARSATPVSIADYTYRLQDRTHLEVTDYIKENGEGTHSFCISGEERLPRKFEIRITSSSILNSIKTEDKPLLYVVWDEKVPIVPWNTPAPAAAQAILESPALGKVLPLPHIASVKWPPKTKKIRKVTVPSLLKWRNGGNAKRFKVYFGKSKEVSLVREVVDAAYDDFDLAFNPGKLSPNTTYYWRVDSVNRDGKVTQGKLWFFRSPE